VYSRASRKSQRGFARISWDRRPWTSHATMEQKGGWRDKSISARQEALSDIGCTYSTARIGRQHRGAAGFVRERHC
jgi:hypothetical protein